MPRSADCVLLDDDSQLLDYMLENSEKCEIAKKKQSNWGEIAPDVKTSVETVKRAMPKSHPKETTATRRSARLRSAEQPRETRKSHASNSKDNLIAVPTTKTTEINTTDNSCTSSVCGSPKNEEKRFLKAEALHLDSIMEDDYNFDGFSQTNSICSSLQDFKNRFDENFEILDYDNTISTTDGQLGESKPKYEQKAPISKLPAPERAPQEKQQLRSRFSEPPQLTKKNIVQPTLDNAYKKPIKPKGPDESTRTFFESIAVTVSSLPQHVQATIKSQLCNIVAENLFEFFCLPVIEAQQ